MANRSSNKTAVPEAKGALDKFKYEVASNRLETPNEKLKDQKINT